MKRSLLHAVITAACLAGAAHASAQVSIVPGGAYTQNFDALGTASGSWQDDSPAFLPGWYAAYTNTSTLVLTPHTAYTASAGGSVSSTVLYATGVSGSSERSLGGMGSSTSQQLFAWRLVNGSAAVITNLVLTYDGEEWRCGTPANTTISVSYKIFSAGSGSLGAAGWTPGPASLTFVSPVSASAAALNGNLPANRVAGLTGALGGIVLQPGEELWLKWTVAKADGANILVAIDNVSVSVPKGTPPVIGTIPNMSVVVGTTSVTNSFTVSDLEDDAVPTPLPAPTASSSNEAVVSAANVVFGGTGSTRTVYVIAGASTGSATITVSLTDADGNIGQQTFNVTVTPSDLPPLISAPVRTNTLVNVPVVVPFTALDPEMPASELVVTGWVASYSGTILSEVAMGTDAGGTNRTATITPVTDAHGVGIVTLSVSDTNAHTTTVSLAVMVLPDGNTVFSEPFDYPLNANLLNSSPGFWIRRNSNAQTINLRTASDTAAAWIRPKSGSDDLAAPLAYGPYRAGTGGAVLYTRFTAQWFDFGDIPVVGDSSGPFLLLATGSGASADQVMQVATRTNGVPEGAFRLILSNGEGVYSEHPANLAVGVPYDIVVRYDVATAQATLWINETSASPGVSATDNQAPVNVSHVCLRQEPDMGNIYLDDLQVIAIQRPLLSAITPAPGGNVEILFSAGAGDAIEAFGVERAASLEAGYAGVNATITSLGNGQFKAVTAASGDKGFYRIKRAAFVF